MKRTSKFTTAIFVIAGLILVFGKQEWFPEFYRPQFMGAMAFISAFLIVLSSLIFKLPEVPANPVKNSIDFFQTSLIIILSLNGLGALGLFQLYKIGFEYDKFLHFIVPFISVVAISYFLYHFYELPFKKSIILAAILVIASGFVWEFFEFFGDNLFKTQMWGYSGKFIIKDTVWDLAMNFFGVIAGTLGLMIFKSSLTEYRKYD